MRNPDPGNSIERSDAGSSSPVSSSHQERKRTKKVRKAAAQDRAAENMRMVAAAQAAGVVPKTVTRESLGWSSPERARARALVARATATESPKIPAESRPTSPLPRAAQPSPATRGPEVEQTPQQETADGSTLFDLVAERGVRIRDHTDDGVPAPDSLAKAIANCPVRFAVETRAAPRTDWTAKCLRPPFDVLWLEYPHQELLCGALITVTDNGGRRLSIQFVTSNHAGRKVPLWWPGPEVAELTADGLLARRRPPAFARNNIGQPQSDAVGNSFDAVYLHLALINEVHTRNLWAHRPNAAAAVLPAKFHELDGPVVLMWGDPPTPGTQHPLDGPRHAPVGHQVRGHQRRLREGGTTWVRPHRRGEGDTEGARNYQVKQRGNGSR